MLLVPVAFITSRSTVRNHDGTPDRLVMFSLMLAFTSVGSFSAQSSISATCLPGTRSRFTIGLMFSMRLAERSPMRVPGAAPLTSLAKLPPKMNALPANSRLAGFILR